MKPKFKILHYILQQNKCHYYKFGHTYGISGALYLSDIMFLLVLPFFPFLAVKLPFNNVISVGMQASNSFRASCHESSSTCSTEMPSLQ